MCKFFVIKYQVIICKLLHASLWYWLVRKISRTRFIFIYWCSYPAPQHIHVNIIPLTSVIIRNNMSIYVVFEQQQQKKDKSIHVKCSFFFTEDLVMLMKISANKKWLTSLGCTYVAFVMWAGHKSFRKIENNLWNIHKKSILKG